MTEQKHFPIEKSDLVPVKVSEEDALEAALVFPTSHAAIEKTGDDLVVIASTPHELVAAQAATIGRMREKLGEAEEDERQAQSVIDAVVEAQLAVNSAAERSLTRARQRVRFLRKVIDALEAGYVIVPNFPAETIAVRVKRQGPRSRSATSTWGKQNAINSVTAERPDDLPTGEGRYVDPDPICQTDVEEVEGKPNEKRHVAYPVEFDELIGLPAQFLKPTVIKRTGKVLARKIFDEIAVVNMPSTRDGMRFFSGQRPQTAGVGDPMVIGRLIDRSRGGHVLSFLVAWFIDTREI